MSDLSVPDFKVPFLSTPHVASHGLTRKLTTPFLWVMQASERITAIATALEALSDKDKQDLIKKVHLILILSVLQLVPNLAPVPPCPQTNGVFEFQIKNADGAEQCWTIDLKKDGNVYKGKAQPKSDVTIMVSGMYSAHPTLALRSREGC